MENNTNINETIPCEPCEKHSFHPKLKAAAWISLLAGFFAARLLPVNSSPLGSLLLSVFIFALTAVFIFSEGRKLKIKDVVIPTVATIISAGTIATSVPVLRDIISVTLIVLYLYWVRCALGSASEGFPGKFAFFELIKAVFVVAIPSVGTIWRVLFSKKKEGSKSMFGWILLGIVVALIPTAAIVSLLSYDKAFTDLLAKLTDWNVFGTYAENVTALFLGVPVAMFVFALLYASREGLRENMLSENTTLRVISAIRIAPAPLAAAAMTPALLIYVIFFISQKNNYIYALTGLKPDGINYSDFARNGFFELCAVAAINAVIILAVTLFTRRAKEKEPLIRVYSAIYSVFTLVLIATAISKMLLYIREYGLTRLRLLTSCFMILLAICFGALLLAQFVRKIRLVGVFAISAILVLSAVTLIDTDRVIGEYNVNAYLSGAHKEIDTDHFYALGNGAVPSAVKLYQSPKTDSATKENIKYFLENTAWELGSEAEENTIFERVFSLSIPKLQAEKALKDAGFSLEAKSSNDVFNSQFSEE